MLQAALNGASLAGNAVADQNEIKSEYPNAPEIGFKSWHKYADMPRANRLSALRADVQDEMEQRSYEDAKKRDNDFIAKLQADYDRDQAEAERLHERLYNGQAPASPIHSAPKMTLGDLVAGFVGGVASGGQFEQTAQGLQPHMAARAEFQNQTAEAAYQSQLRQYAAQNGLDEDRFHNLLSKTGQTQAFMRKFEADRIEKDAQAQQRAMESDARRAHDIEMGKQKHSYKMDELSESAQKEATLLKSLGYQPEEIRTLLGAKYQKNLEEVGLIKARTESTKAMPGIERDKLKVRWAELRSLDKERGFRQKLDIKKFEQDSDYRSGMLEVARQHVDIALKRLNFDVDQATKESMIGNELKLSSGDAKEFKSLSTKFTGLEGAARYIQSEIDRISKDFDPETAEYDDPRKKQLDELNKKLQSTQIEMAQIRSGLEQYADPVEEETWAPGLEFFEKAGFKKPMWPFTSGKKTTTWRPKQSTGGAPAPLPGNLPSETDPYSPKRPLLPRVIPNKKK